MARPAKPFPHQGWYKTNLGGGPRRKLCRIEEGIEKARGILRQLQGEQERNGGRLPPELTVAEAAALYLREVETDKGADHRTFEWYRRNLVRLVERLGTRKLRSLAKHDGVEYKRWLKEDARSKRTGRRKGQKLGNVKTPKPLSTTSVNHHLRAAKTLLGWAVESEYLPKNPWASKKVRLERERGRERIITDEEFRSLLRHCTDADFKQVLLTLRLTAARPGELQALTWGMVRWDTHCWVIHRHKTESTAKQPKPRIIPMPPAVEKLLRQREAAAKKAHPEIGSVLVFPPPDMEGWKKDTMARRFRRLRERAGIEVKDGENLVLYSSRHTRLTELAPGVSGAVLQEVAGHTNFTTTQRYLHLANQQVYAAVLEADRKRQESGK
ncbi:MAG: tyrosine-type recombinase/integrase [Gemmataceae bacterium]